MSRKQVTELTKGYSGPKSTDYVWLMVTWEWNNGWNLITSRRATDEEIKAGTRNQDYA